MDVFTQGFALRPLAAAFFANKPAPSITAGLEVLVQDVIAAITTAPSPSRKLSPPFSTRTPVLKILLAGLPTADAPPSFWKLAASLLALRLDVSAPMAS